MLILSLVDMRTSDELENVGFTCRAYRHMLVRLIKMEGEKYEILVLLRFLWKKFLNARAAAKEKCDVEGDSVVSTRTSQTGTC